MNIKSFLSKYFGFKPKNFDPEIKKEEYANYVKICNGKILQLKNKTAMFITPTDSIQFIKMLRVDFHSGICEYNIPNKFFIAKNTKKIIIKDE